MSVFYLDPFSYSFTFGPVARAREDPSGTGLFHEKAHLPMRTSIFCTSSFFRSFFDQKKIDPFPYSFKNC